MNHKIYKAAVVMLFPLLMVGCGNSNKPENQLTITCTKGPMTLYLKSGGEAISTGRTLNLMWSKDKKNWQKKDLLMQARKRDTVIWQIDLNEGESVYLVGNNPKGFIIPGDIETEGLILLNFTDKNTAELSKTNDEPNSAFTVSGNIMSLIRPTNFANLKVPSVSCFSCLFKNSNVVSAENLILPNKLNDYCFSSMFDLCNSLAKAPSLPATTLKFYCYREMFKHCIALQTSPDLPASELVEGCYQQMFDDCNSLKHIRVGFGKNDEWPENCTKRWLYHTSSMSEGVFEWAGSNDAKISKGRSHDTVPEGCTIKHIDL